MMRYNNTTHGYDNEKYEVIRDNLSLTRFKRLRTADFFARGDERAGGRGRSTAAEWGVGRGGGRVSECDLKSFLVK